MSYSIVSGTLVLGPMANPSEHSLYENFILSVNPDGSRTLRTITRSPKGDLVRDVHQTVARDWRAVEGYGRLFFGDELQGSIWRRVMGDTLHSHLWAPGKPLDSAEFPARPNLILGFHPVTADAWKLNFYDVAKGGSQEVRVHTVSSTWNGSSLGHGEERVTSAEYLGRKQITTPAGTFDSEGFMWHTGRIDSDLEVWRTGEDHIFVQLLQHGRKMLYQLGSLEVIEKRD